MIAPRIDDTGVIIPTYDEIYADLVSEMKRIYGTDIYLDADSPDTQLLATFALSIATLNATIGAILNSFSPVTASGVNLDKVNSITGIYRRVPSASNVDVLLTGTPNSKLLQVQLLDINNNLWVSNRNLQLDNVGKLLTGFTSVLPGVKAGINEINKIAIHIEGLISATNPTPAVIGNTLETDTSFRTRQLVSTRIPQYSSGEGLVGALLTLQGVRKVRLFMNNTASTDEYGFPAHSITTLVQGGNTEEIARLIAIKKTMGVITNGTIEVTVTDKYQNEEVVRFERPELINIVVQITLQKLLNFSSAILDPIKTNILEYISNLNVGENIYASKLMNIIYLLDPSISTPSFIIDEIKFINSATQHEFTNVLLMQAVDLTDESSITFILLG